MNVKRCPKCKEVKPIDEFHKNKGRKDGHSKRCKKCAIQTATANYAKNREHRIELSRAYYARTKKCRQVFNSRNPDHIRLDVRKRNRPSMPAYNREWRKQNPDKSAAHRAVQRVIQDGNIPAVGTCACFVCGAQAQDYHHLDYSKPLEVFPMCTSCHQKWHVANK